ncbi:outer membrane porin, OprD family [Erwinia sp. J316]|uniref:Outer membrane porin, OprD family n=2 Tax=Erwinia sorbitola TaxID=2681984 RepID=A0ABW9R7Z4_9GAMM|nr:outer membrane porin, OprD family [Erwinia sorbitola]
MMHLFARSKPLLGTLILTTAPLPLFAAEEVKYELPDAINSFITDSHADISLRNQFKNLNTSDYGDRSVQTAWGQGISLDFSSGYLADFIGVDASYYQVLKLAASDNFWGRSILHNEDGKAKGFNKFGQLFAKIKLEGEDSYFKLYSGWQKIHKWGALTNSSRAIPSTYQGWRMDSGYGPLMLRGAWVTRYSDRGSPDQIRFETADRKKQIDHIATGEVIYQDKGYSALYFFGESHKYLQRHGVELGWQPESLAENKVKIVGMLYYNHGLSDWTAMNPDYRPFNNDAFHPAFYAEWQQNNWKHKLGAAYTKANSTDHLGYFERHMTKNSRGRFNSMADAWGNDYVGNNEKMVGWTTEYLITPEVKLGLQSAFGWGMKYQGQQIRRGETILFSKWQPSEIKNLSLQLSGGPSWNYQSNKNRPLLTEDGKPKRAVNHSVEFQVDYAFNLF